MKFVSKFLAFASAWLLVGGMSHVHAQTRPVNAVENCYASGTVRQFRDNEFARYSAKPAIAGSLGLGCDLFDIRGLPLGMGLVLGAFGEVMETAPIDRQSGMSGDLLVKRMGTMGFVGGTAEFKLPSIAAVTPSLLLRYGVEVGSVVLPRGSYTDANGWEKSFAKRYTQEVGLAGCLDYNKAVKLCAEYAKLTYDTYPHVWTDPNGRVQGRPEAITAANELVGRLLVPFSLFRM